MNNIIKKINNVSSSNYESRDGRSILNIVIGMTNDVRSGYGYAQTYKSPLSPKISYNYIIDKEGRVYQTIPDEFAPFCLNNSTSAKRIDNQESIAICFMPEWEGDNAYYDYEVGSDFPTNPILEEEFLLTKQRKKDGITYPTGHYVYKTSGWELIEALDVRSIKRPYDSDLWGINDKTEATLLSLVKWLQVKHNVNDNRVYRVYDFYRTYNPAPFIIEESVLWHNFKDLLAITEFDVWQVVPETISPISEDYTNIISEQEINDLIEQYGPDTENVLKERFKDENISLSSVNADEIGITSMPSNKFSFELGIHNYKDKLWHISNVSREVTWKTYIEDQCDELDFTFINKDFEIDLKEGNNVGYWINGVAGFNGNLFTITQKGSNKEQLEGTAYGWMHYLQYETWTSFENKTASEIFDILCTTANIPHKVVNPSSYVIKSVVCYGKTSYEAIKDAIMETMVHEKKWYIIQSNFGTLEFRDILAPENIKGIKFSEDSAIIDWDFDTSITDSANVIITYTEGEKDENGKPTATVTGQAKDESSIREWGRLVKIIKDQKDGDEAKLNVSAEDWLKFYNSPRRTLRLECLGIPTVMAGNIIYIEIDNVVSVGSIQGCLVVDECTHKIIGGKHTMELRVEIVQDGTLQAMIYNSYQVQQQQGEQELLEVRVNG